MHTLFCKGAIWDPIDTSPLTKSLLNAIRTVRVDSFEKKLLSSRTRSKAKQSLYVNHEGEQRVIEK